MASLTLVTGSLLSILYVRITFLSNNTLLLYHLSCKGSEGCASFNCLFLRQDKYEVDEFFLLIQWLLFRLFLLQSSLLVGMVDYISKCHDCSHSLWVICWPLFNIFLLESTIFAYLSDCNSYFYEYSHFSIRVSLASIQVSYITAIFLRVFGWSQF